MTAIASIRATYVNYSDDGYIINVTESGESAGPAVASAITFHEYLKLSGCDTGTRSTSEPGGFVLYPTVTSRRSCPMWRPQLYGANGSSG